MILSDGDIRKALDKGEIEIDPTPAEDQFQPSALDLTLGNIFKVWSPKLRTPGTKVILNLADQNWPSTSDAWLIDATTETDGSFILPPQKPAATNTRTSRPICNLSFPSQAKSRIQF